MKKVILLLDSEMSFQEINGIRIIDDLFCNLNRINKETNKFKGYNIGHLNIMVAIAGHWGTVRTYIKEHAWEVDGYMPELESIEIAQPAITDAIETLFITPEDKFFMVIRGDFILPPEEWDKVFYQSILLYPVVFTSLKTIKYNTFEVDSRDSALRTISRKPIIMVDCGIYKMSYQMIGYMKERHDIADAIEDWLKEARLKWGIKSAQRKTSKVTLTPLLVFPLKGWNPLR